MVKGILMAYELVPEAHRQQFITSWKKESQTYMKFAWTKEICLIIDYRPGYQWW